MNVEINPIFTAILLQQTKRNGTTLDEELERFVRAGLSAERQRPQRERVKITIEDEDVIIQDPCTETYLRGLFGDDREIYWWLISCALVGG